MPADLTLYGRAVGTVFDLLGDKENDITCSVGWALAESEELSGVLLKDVVPAAGNAPADSVRLQEGVSGAGFTDIEILVGDGKTRVVIEAKRGYNLPQPEQLAKYATRTQPPPTVLLVLAEAAPDFAAGKIPDQVDGVPVLYRSWRQIESLVSEAACQSGRHAEKRLLRDLSRYLKGLMTMQDVDTMLPWRRRPFGAATVDFGAQQLVEVAMQLTLDFLPSLPSGLLCHAAVFTTYSAYSFG